MVSYQSITPSRPDSARSRWRHERRDLSADNEPPNAVVCGPACGGHKKIPRRSSVRVNCCGDCDQSVEAFPDGPAACERFRPTGRAGFRREVKVKKLYVGNLPFSATEDSVAELFEKHGTVHSVALINDRETGRPRGFGFVEMDDAGAQAAMEALNGQDMGGRPLNVNEAQDRRRGGGGGGRRERW
ncbi:MAG: hypothetical protein JSW67_13335 [Candidatus Latescibacterota bacterium]|nr:MAG: hypothetical protein JSW67_13335 [Candidatus Latescibacterota bacterium]